MKLQYLFLLPCVLLTLVACKDEHPGGPTPELDMNPSDFYVDCVKLSGGAIGGDFGALHVKGRITNASPFRVKLTGSYKGSAAEAYRYFANQANNFRPVDSISLNPGETISGSVIYIDEQPVIGIPAAMDNQTTDGFLSVDAYPVDDADERLPDSNVKKFVVAVPRPEGFIPNSFGRIECPCYSISECGDQEQPVNSQHW